MSSNKPKARAWVSYANKVNGFEAFLNEKDKDGVSNLEKILNTAQKMDPPAFGKTNENFYGPLTLLSRKLEMNMDFGSLRKPLAQEGAPLTSDFLDAQMKDLKSEAFYHGKDSGEMINLRGAVDDLSFDLAGRDMKTALKDPEVKDQMLKVYKAALDYMEAKQRDAGKLGDPDFLPKSPNGKTRYRAAKALAEKMRQLIPEEVKKYDRERVYDNATADVLKSAKALKQGSGIAEQMQDTLNEMETNYAIDQGLKPEDVAKVIAINQSGLARQGMGVTTKISEEILNKQVETIMSGKTFQRMMENYKDNPRKLLNMASSKNQGELLQEFSKTGLKIRAEEEIKNQPANHTLNKNVNKQMNPFA